MTATYRGNNIKTFRVWYTGFTSNGTFASRNPINLVASAAAGVVAAGQIAVGSVLCRDPFAWDQGGSKVNGVTVDAAPTVTRTGVYEGLDYTQPETAILNQHKVIVVEPGDAPARSPNGGRWVTVVDAADVAGVLCYHTAAIVAGNQLAAVNGSFAAGVLPATSVAELLALKRFGIGEALEALTITTLAVRPVKLCGDGNPQLAF